MKVDIEDIKKILWELHLENWIFWLTLGKNKLDKNNVVSRIASGQIAEAFLDISKNIDDWFRCIGGALPVDDFLKALQDVGLDNLRVLESGRNARCGHELALCAVIRAEKK